MANRTLSDLPVTTVIAGADLIHTRQSTTDKSVTEAKIAEYIMNLSDYSPTVVAVTGATHTISTTIRKQLIICTIAGNCTMTFPGAFGDAQEIIIRNDVGSSANVIGLPNSEILYPGSEIVFIWDGSAWKKRTFSTNLLTGTTVPSITPSFIGQTFVDGTNDNVYVAVGTGSSADWLYIAQATQNIISINADYVIADTIPSGSKILVSPNSSTQKGIIIVTLPTMADNIGKWYDIEFKTGQGLVMIDGEGAETLMFRNTTIPTALLYSAGASYRVSNNGSNWVMKGTNLYKTNWFATNDETDRNFGFAVTYDNGSGTSTKNTDWTGMVITEATSGFTAVVVEDTGGTGTTGILYCLEASTSFTQWTNDRVLTASNGQTIDINEVSGSSKNIDYNIFHDFGINISTITDYHVYWSADGTENASYVIDSASVSGGFSWRQISTVAIQNQSNASGIFYQDSSGNTQTVASGDDFIKVVLDFSC